MTTPKMTTPEHRDELKRFRDELKRFRAHGFMRSPSRLEKREQLARWGIRRPIEKGASNAPMLSPRRVTSPRRFNLTVDDLKEQAKSLGLRGYSRLRKAELEEMIRQHLAGASYRY